MMLMRLFGSGNDLALIVMFPCSGIGRIEMSSQQRISQQLEHLVAGMVGKDDLGDPAGAAVQRLHYP